MSAEHDRRSHEDPAIEFLARESHVPIVDVARLYGNELTKLEVGARITHFLPIFAIRNVREVLRQRSTGKVAFV